MKKGKLLVGVVFVIIIAIGLGIYFVQNKKVTPKIYKSEKTGLGIEYPESFGKVETKSINSDEELKQFEEKVSNITDAEVILQSNNKEIIAMISEKIDTKGKDEKIALQEMQKALENFFDAEYETWGTRPNVFLNEIKTLKGKQVLEVGYETEEIKIRTVFLIKDEYVINILYVAKADNYNDKNAKYVEYINF